MTVPTTGLYHSGVYNPKSAGTQEQSEPESINFISGSKDPKSELAPESNQEQEKQILVQNLLNIDRY